MKKNKLKFSSLFLPNQPPLKKYFKSKNFEDHLYYFIEKNSNVIRPKKKYKIYNPSEFSIEEMASNPISLSFLNFITNLIKPKFVLEIGSFIGLSTMELSKNIKKNGKVIAIEKFEKFYNIAKKNFKINKLDKKINIILGDANTVLSSRKIRQKFDLIFIDGNKEKYKELFILCQKKLTKNGLIIVDNIFNQGDVLNRKTITKKGAGVKRFLQYLKKKKINKCILPFYDGIMLIKNN